MSADIERGITDYVSRVLLRYFRNAVALRVSRPRIESAEDFDLLKLHWAVSEPVRDLLTYVSEHPHELQSVLEMRRQIDVARVRGRVDARATVIQRLLTGHPTLTVFHEPIRSFNSGANHVLIWVLEQAWHLVLRFESLLPVTASYLPRVEETASALEKIRRFDMIHQATKEIVLARRPGPAALKEASRSRRQIYSHAYRAYRALEDIETGNQDALSRLLNDTLFGPLPVWQRFELAVGLGIAQAISEALGSPIKLGFLYASNCAPMARISSYAVHWQSRTDAYAPPVPEPSEAIAQAILTQYTLAIGSDRPDIVVTDERTGDVVALIEVKFFSGDENDGSDALRTAVYQLVRYARGYRTPGNLDGLLDRSVIAMIRKNTEWIPKTKPFGVPWILDFDDLSRREIESWAQALISTTSP